MRTCNCESEPEPMESESPDDIGGDSLDFDHWTSLISETENTYFDDIEKISSVYDPFLSEFPLCHGYWRRYADHKTRLCSVDKAAEVFERGVQSATYSVPLWVDYCNFSMSAFEDPSDIRRLFRRGLSFVGKDYLCHTLWDQYIEFEYSQQKWSLLAQIYIQALRFPTKKLHRYYESMKRLAALCEEDMKCQINSTVDLQSEAVLDSKVPACYSDREIALVVKDLLDPEIGLERFKAVQKYLNIGKLLYEEACRLDGRIGTFEINIRRSYFHVKPLDAGQLENWHYYLDFVEMQGDFDWAVKLYERCLIPCANYPEFWMRYVEFMEINGGREIANYALDRATRIFLKRVSVIHLFNARFKEKIGDAPGARAAFLQCETESDSHFVKNVMLKANMEKRMGNIKAASNAYKEALEMAEEEKILLNLPILYVHFSRFTYMMTDNADAARDVLIDGIKHLPHCKQLLEELINFAIMHGGKQHLNVVDSIVAKAISPEPGVSDGLNAKDAEDISSLYLEFVDLCGTIHEVRRAWTRHVRLFPYSMRTASFHQKAISTKPLKRARGTEENMVAMPQQQPVDCNSDSLIELPFNDRKMSLSDNQYIESRQEGIDQLSDDKLSVPGSQLKQTTSDKMQTGQLKNVQETLKPSSPEISRVRSRDVAPEADLPSVYLVEAKQVSPEVSKEPKGNTPEPKASSVELGCQVAEGNESLETSQEGTNRSSVHQVCDNNKPEEYPKPLSLESLSLNSLENSNLDSLPSTSHKYIADSQENANLDSIPSTSQKYEADFEEHADLDSIPSISHQYEADSQEIKNLDSVPSVSDQYEADSQDNTNLDSVPSSSRKYEAESQENTNMDSMPSVSPKIEAKSQENTNLDSLPSVSHKYKAYSQVNTNMDSVPSISRKYEADSQENTNLDSMPSVSYRNEESQGTCTSNGRKLESNSKSNEDYSPRSARGLGTAGNEVVNHIPMQVLSQPAVNSYGDRRQNNRRDWRQNNHSGKVRRDTDFGFQGRLQRKSYHQQQPVSPKQYPQAETGRPMPGSLDHPSQFVSSQIPQIEQGSQVHNPYQEAAATPANTMAPNAWPVQNVQQPNYISTSQPQLPVQSAPPQMSQSSILGQYGIQNSQAYNQMWQSYYYQQQLALQQLLHQAQQQPNPQQQQVLLQQYQQLHHQLQQQYAAQMQLQQPYQQQQLQQVQSQHDLQQQQYNQHSQMQQQQLQQPPQPHQQQQPSQPHQQQQQPPQPHQQQQQPPQPHQ